MAMVAWPSISETILGLTFLVRSSVAHVWRRSWNLISGNCARLRSALNGGWSDDGGSPVHRSQRRTPGRSPATGSQPYLSLLQLTLEVLLRASSAP